MMTALLVGVVYCQKNTNGEKEIKTEDRKVAAYESVEVSGAYHLVLTEGEGGALKVKGQKEVLPYLKTSVSNKVLYVSIDNKYKLKTSLTVYVPINTSLKKIVTKGAVDVSTQGKLQVAGAGDVDITGTAERLNAVVKGAGDIDLKNLIAKKATLRIAGAGNISAHVTEEVDASIAGAGGITVKGNPPVFKKSVKGIGRIKIEE